MHREIEKFVSDCKEKMEKIGWSYRDLAKACGMHKDSFPRIFGPQKKRPADSTILTIAEVLGVQVPFPPGTSIRVSRKDVRKLSRGDFGKKSVHAYMYGDREKQTLSETEEKLKKASICFRQGVALLEEIDVNAEKAIKEIAERMRATSMLKESLEVFRKH